MEQIIPSNGLLIAGKGGGKKVNVVPAHKPAYELLETAAKTNHWARLAVAGLTALSSGVLGKNNIFVKPSHQVANWKDKFDVILPGCRATVERLPNDSYWIVSLAMDAAYFELNNQNTMTGLYRAEKVKSNWMVDYLKNGQIVPDSGKVVRQRIVGIADTVYEDAEIAANEMASLISKAPGAGGKFFKNFDLHFTGGEGKSLGGLKNYSLACNPLSNESIHGSALMLATTMYAAKDIKGVSWVSEFGGSAVFTQAMKILADQQVKLEDHTAFLYRPNTNVEEAASLAHKIGLDLDRKFVFTTAGDFMGNRNQVGMIFKRFKAEKNYRVGNMCWDLVAQGKNVQGGVGMATLAIGSAGVAMTAPTWPILASIGAVLGVTVGVLKAGDSLAEHIAPRFYNKHIGKIK
jgi:hypothetical protein